MHHNKHQVIYIVMDETSKATLQTNVKLEY